MNDALPKNTMNMKPCCLKHTSTFCPDCGARIYLGGDLVGGRLLIELECEVKRLEKRIEKEKYALARETAVKSLGKTRLFAQWVRERITAEIAQRVGEPNEKEEGSSHEEAMAKLRRIHGAAV